MEMIKENYQSINTTDRKILRDLAKTQLEIANSDKNLSTIKDWYKLNNCEPGARPLIHIELGTFEHEVIPKRLQCTGHKAREIETQLYSNFLNFQIFGDDWVVEDTFDITWNQKFTPFDLPLIRHELETSDGHEFVEQIQNLKAFTETMKPSSFSVDKTGTLAWQDFVDDVIGDILPTKLVANLSYSVLTQDIVHLMSMQNMFLSIYDYPDAFKSMIEQLADDYIGFMRFKEDNGLLLPTTGHESLGQGSLCYNDLLPKNNVTSHKDVWGFMDSQETVGISPDMFAEFIFPAYQRIAKELGRVSYGCCEPIDPVWESISKLDNLGKVSISPWANEQKMGEALKGKPIVFHRKPSPNYLGVSKELNEASFRTHIEDTLQAAQGCTLEITQRDVYTIHYNEAKVRRYVEIIRESIDKHWS